jgi:ribosomal protein S18 acetylase RimI-like enzyme
VSDTLTIRSATLDDAPAVGALFTAAFHEPVAYWLAPDPATRQTVLTEFFTLVAEDAVAFGSVEIIGDCEGAAAWFDLTEPAPDPDPDQPNLRYAQVYGPHADRWTTFERITGERHPEPSHHYLLLVGVRPDRQNQGLGRALVEHHHEHVATGLPTYLEATTAESRRLYARLGYTDHGEPITLPDGPTIYPMWRQA